MTNMLGEEREPHPLEIKDMGKTLYLSRNGNYVGYVSENGWTGKSYMIDYPLKEPMIYQIFGALSLTEMQQIIEAWKNKT